MAATRPISRYSSCDSRSSVSSQFSDASSADLNPKTKIPSLKHLVGNPSGRRLLPESSSPAGIPCRALVRAKSSDLASLSTARTKNEQNFTSLVKRFMEKKARPKALGQATLIIPSDFIAEDLKKTAAKGSNVSGFHRKFFQKAIDRTQKKALAEVKENTRTLAMVLRSERDLLSQNKEYEVEIKEIRRMLDEKNEEVEELKDLCMKQREEIKALKSAILFPDVTNSQHELLLEKQGTELKPASKVIPTLQEQVASLTGQLQSLAEGLAEVKADKYAAKPYFDGHIGTPRTLVYDEEAAKSLEFSYEDPITPGSPDDMILEDMNPCLTPRFAKTWTKDYGYNGPLCKEEEAFGNRVFKEKCVDNKKLFMSSKHSKKQSSGSSAPFMSSKHSKKQSSGSSAPATSKSDVCTYRYGKFKY